MINWATAACSFIFNIFFFFFFGLKMDLESIKRELNHNSTTKQFNFFKRIARQKHAGNRIKLFCLMMINIKVIKRVTEARWPQFDSKNTRESNLIKYKGGVYFIS